jgi:hypothetical protein
MFWHRKGLGSVTLTGHETQQFGEIIRELMKDDNIFNNFTMSELEELTQESILPILTSDPLQRQNEIDKQITELRQRLKGDLRPETFIIPVTNLILERRQLGIGNVKLFMKHWQTLIYDASSRYSLRQRKRQRQEFRKNVLEKLK